MEHMEDMMLPSEELNMLEQLPEEDDLSQELPEEEDISKVEAIAEGDVEQLTLSDPLSDEELPGEPAQESPQMPATGWQKVKGIAKKIDRVIGIIVHVLYKLRKFFMAAPVVYYAVKLAQYNNEHLPSVVGINLQANGVFGELLNRELAVMGPLAVTCACLVLMFLSRKSLYAWAISIFSLALPIVLLLSNRYPA